MQEPPVQPLILLAGDGVLPGASQVPSEGNIHPWPELYPGSHHYNNEPYVVPRMPRTVGYFAIESWERAQLSPAQLWNDQVFTLSRRQFAGHPSFYGSWNSERNDTPQVGTMAYERDVERLVWWNGGHWEALTFRSRPENPFVFDESEFDGPDVFTTDGDGLLEFCFDGSMFDGPDLFT